MMWVNGTAVTAAMTPLINSHNDLSVDPAANIRKNPEPIEFDALKPCEMKMTPAARRANEVGLFMLFCFERLAGRTRLKVES
jgi:hypothetical protein